MDSTLGLGFTWERGGKRALRIRQADALLQVAGLEMLDTRRRQQVALHEAYFGLKGAQERVRIAEANRQSSTEQLAAADKQVATGAMAPVDRARLAVDDLAVADAAREAALDLHDARHALALLLGRDDSHDLSADDPWPDPGNIADTRAFDPQQRADLRAARSRLVAADAGGPGAQRAPPRHPAGGGGRTRADRHQRCHLGRIADDSARRPVTCTRRDPARRSRA